MPFYIRKSLRAGPLRFNLSKSGIGISTGIPGFRIGIGPRGNYVHMGRNGFYYRATLPSWGHAQSNKSQQLNNPSPTPPALQTQRVEKTDVLKLNDSTSTDLLSELDRNQKKISSFPLAIIFSVVMFAILALARVPPAFLIISLVLVLVLLLLAHERDAIAKTTVIFYDLDQESENAYEALHQAFQELGHCSLIWHVDESADVANTKLSAGATSVIRRQIVQIQYKIPDRVSTNIKVPTLFAGTKSMFFFPDRLLVSEKGNFGAVSYPELMLNLLNSRFIEDGRVPSDAQTVGVTWRFPNKDGTPDRRYRNNKQIPVLLYSEIQFSSASGLDEVFQFSRPYLGSRLESAIKSLALLQQNSANSKGLLNQPWYMEYVKPISP